ncbi:SHOCT domain-containing protein [Streptomyces sp. NBC_00184]|uniref:SHOCT domain-containing protein n=1 Tax=unclassified Streptomyces TaxID=2593676 RepID=UPI002E2E0CAC|nr:SHOCT domain-containing protein [Streptomyces sp. NBC_00184]
MARVQTGCPDCKRCTNSAVGEGARKAGRWTAGIATMGLSEAGMAFTRNCRGCGHAMSLHDRKDNNALTRDPDHRGAPVVPGHAAPYPPAPAPAWGAPPPAPAPAWGAPPEGGTPAWGAPPPAPAPAPVAAPAPAAPAQNAQEVMNLLRQLGELRDAGVITAADFEAKKADFLSRL